MDAQTIGFIIIAIAITVLVVSELMHQRAVRKDNDMHQTSRKEWSRGRKP